MPELEDDDLGMALFVLRSLRHWRQEDVARAAGWHPTAISRFEKGEGRRSLPELEALAAAMGYPPSTGRRTVTFLHSLPGDASPEHSPFVAHWLGLVAGMAVDSGLGLASASEALFAVGFDAAGVEPSYVGESVAEARERAIGLWARLSPYSPPLRRPLVLAGREFHSFALCELVCAESAWAAPDSAEEAAELARLALLIAGLVEGEPGWRKRLEGLSGGHLANALRVGGDLNLAEQTFAGALGLWDAGSASDPGILDPTRLLDLEASLRKDQRRLPEALSLIDRALVTDPVPEVAGRLLIKKAGTLEKLGRNEEALAILREAAPLVEAEDHGRLQFAVRFGALVNLCELGRYAEAEPLLGEVGAMAERLGKKLDLLRLRWLEARVAGGLGRTDEAIETLTQVQRDLAGLGIAYDAALATLELAVLLLDHGRTAEVKKLAEQSKRIFDAQGVAREALATLEVFRRAAGREMLTAALARRLLDELRGKSAAERE